MRLLIVEDSELIRQMTRLAFPPKENDLQDAANGVEALMHLSRAQQPFDAILLDLQMPDMNGVEFLRALRQRPQHRHTPVVVATSERDNSPLMQEVSRMGVAAIVKKPWKPRELASVVAQACAGRSPHIDGTQHMTQAEYDLLRRLEAGPAVFHPTEPGTEGHEDFQWTVVRLLELRARGWIRLPDGGITSDADGKAMLAGPCDLTEAGRRALADDRRLGPRA